jgi:hypothetical protein
VLIWEREPAGHDTDDRAFSIIHPNHAPDDAGVSGKVTPPRIIAKNDDCVGRLLVRIERPTKRRLDSEQRENRRGNSRAFQANGVVSGQERGGREH